MVSDGRLLWGPQVEQHLREQWAPWGGQGAGGVGERSGVFPENLVGK